MEPAKKQNGAFVGLVVILIIIIVGGIYVWQSKVKSAIEEKARIEIQSKTLTPNDNTELENLDKDLGDLEVNAGVDVNTLQ